MSWSCLCLHVLGEVTAHGLEKGLLSPATVPDWTPVPASGAQGTSTPLDPHGVGPHRGPRGLEGHCLEREGPSLEGPCGWRCPRAPGRSPQGGLRFTRWDAEEDTKAGWGPGQAALVHVWAPGP